MDYLGGENRMYFSFVKNLFRSKRENKEKHEYIFDEILEEGIDDSGDDAYETQINYMKIYRDMKKAMGLDDVKIDFKLYQFSPGTLFFKENKESKYEIEICVLMTCDSQLECYKGSLAHELWHVKTGLELIREIGIDEFVKLQREYDFEKSLAFKTLSEYYSWHKAISEYNDRMCSLTLKSRFNDYKDKKINEIELCDTIAAHCAWKEVHKTENIADNLTEEEKLFVERIMQIIKENSTCWPISLEEFKNIGEEMSQAFMGI